MCDNKLQTGSMIGPYPDSRHHCRSLYLLPLSFHLYLVCAWWSRRFWRANFLDILLGQRSKAWRCKQSSAEEADRRRNCSNDASESPIARSGRGKTELPKTATHRTKTTKVRIVEMTLSKGSNASVSRKITEETGDVLEEHRVERVGQTESQ